jgi:hypothetical protein
MRLGVSLPPNRLGIVLGYGVSLVAVIVLVATLASGLNR